MVVCAALKCTNSSRIKQMRFFKFPSEEKRRKSWMEKCSLEKEPGPFAKLCEVHFEESQFELHRQDGWRKLKPNAVPTLFPEPMETPRKQRKGGRKRRRSTSYDSDDDDNHKPKRKIKKHKRNSPGNDSKKSKKSGSRSSPESSQSAQKENVSPRRRKGRPRKLASTVLESSSDTEIEESEDQAEKEIAQLRRENDSMRQEIAEFEKHNKAMSRVIMELEKHNKAMAFKLQELDKDNKVMTKKLQDLEKQNEDLRAKLNCCFSEEQFSRMEKLMQLGKIERYIPGIK